MVRAFDRQASRSVQLMCQSRPAEPLPPPTTEWHGQPPPPLPPPMRTPLPGSLIPAAGSMLVVLVFIAGVAVGAKMVGGW